MIFNWTLSAYALVITLLSIFLGTALNPFLLVVNLVLFVISLHMKRINWMTSITKLLLLSSFDWLTNLHWTNPMYLLSIGLIFAIEQRTKAWILFFCYSAAFMIVALSTSPWNTKLILQLFNFVIVLFLSRFIVDTVKQTEILNNERNLLSSRDALTGLYNYEKFHIKLDEWVHQDQQLLIILIDCTDLKSMNTSKGFQAGNLILKQVSELLKILFSDALLISRYGGDEFAITMYLGEQEHTLHFVKQQLESELPKLIGMQITYGLSVYPQDGITKDDLILVAEHNLFMMKREMWLKREDHLLRSEKLRVVGELASGMAHEIRNPLTTVRGFLQISKANGYNIENWYTLIMEEINRMSELTGEFLQFSKSRPTQFKIQSLQECIQKVISLTEAEGIRLGHQMMYDAPNEPIHLYMDQDKMVQLLLNLIKNAYEAMNEDGTVCIRLKLLKKHVILEVQDTGQGVPPNQLDKIFHPFFTTKDSGTGLGLSICHKIVHDHDGTIEVESIWQQGTKFMITFPVVILKGETAPQARSLI